MAVEAGKQLWWTKPWPLHLGLCACAMAFVLTLGNPLETQELQWFGQCLRWRFAAGWAPPVERSILHLNIDQDDLKNLSSLETEYATAARIVREASELGARVVAFDIVFSRANAQMAQSLPITRSDLSTGSGAPAKGVSDCCAAASAGLAGAVTE